ncbi:notchless protein [Artemisia annua]|uniref:Notchless protein n=1 Tax=Artemisia annua TaxID=35608 RepID=A0A2U1KEX5_ARTAN|nr:notchless protein [Artemisia annua]
MGLGVVFANQLVKWDAKLQVDVDEMLEKAKAANEPRYFAGTRLKLRGSDGKNPIYQNDSSVQGHKKWITGISWEPVHLQSPCRRFVTSSKHGDARIWDATMRKTVIVLSGHTLAVTCVKWDGDEFIHTGSEDCTIKVWETTQGKLIRELKKLKQDLPGHADEVCSGILFLSFYS